MICEHLDTCSLIHHMGKSVPYTINMMKIKYCEFNKFRCVRYKLSQVFSMEDIPVTLWLSDEMRGMELLESKLNETHRKLHGTT